jgi:hypothetical protein
LQTTADRNGVKKMGLGAASEALERICIEQRLGFAELVAKKAGVHLANPIADKSHHVN